MDKTIVELITAIAPKLYSQYSSGVLVFTQKWMALIHSALNIADEDAYVEANYSFEARLLIAYLVIKDILVNPMVDTFGVSISGGTGSIKKIVTGPTEVERNTVSDDFKDFLKPGGILEMFQAQICSLASKLGIYILGCKEEEVTVIKVLRNADSSYLHKEIIAPEYIHNDL